MFKQILLSGLLCCLTSPVFAEQSMEPQQCPPIKLNTLFPHVTATIGYDLLIMPQDSFNAMAQKDKTQPILVKKPNGTYDLWGYKGGKWQLTPLYDFVLPSDWNNKQKVFVDPNNTSIFTTLATGHTNTGSVNWKVTINEIDPSFSTRYLTVDNVIPYEAHVMTDALQKSDNGVIADFRNKPDSTSATQATVTLSSCEYGVYAADLYLKLYNTDKKGSQHTSLIVLTPLTTMTMSVASILNNNTGWGIIETKPYFNNINFIVHYNPAFTYTFDCSHENVQDPKCNWVGTSAGPAEKSNKHGSIPIPTIWY